MQKFSYKNNHIIWLVVAVTVWFLLPNFVEKFKKPEKVELSEQEKVRTDCMVNAMLTYQSLEAALNNQPQTSEIIIAKRRLEEEACKKEIQCWFQHSGNIQKDHIIYDSAFDSCLKERMKPEPEEDSEGNNE